MIGLCTLVALLACGVAAAIWEKDRAERWQKLEAPIGEAVRTLGGVMIRISADASQFRMEMARLGQEMETLQKTARASGNELARWWSAWVKEIDPLNRKTYDPSWVDDPQVRED